MVLRRVTGTSKIHSFAFLGLLMVLLSTEVAAQRDKQASSFQKREIAASSTDAGPEIMEAYNRILAKYDLKSKKGKKAFHTNLTVADRVKLETLFKKMSKKQQAVQIVGFIPNMPPPPPVVPTDEQLEQWENEKTYGVWIDGQKVPNNTLGDYSNTDFFGVAVSKLSKNAINYGKYIYQVDLMTKGYYEEYYNHRSADKNRTVIFVRTPNKETSGK